MISARRDFVRTLGLAAMACSSRRLFAQTDQIEDLVAANKILASHEVLDAYGHVSVRSDRDPRHYFMSRSLAPALVRAADILESDLDSNLIGGNSPAPALFLERFIHGEIYKARQDVKSVV